MSRSYKDYKDSPVARIKVIGVGGAGGNSVNQMIDSGINDKYIEILVANTDIQDLLKSKAKTKIQLGERITKGLGAGANPEIGKLSAEEDKDKIKAVLEGTDLLFITAGMGGGTGTGAAPVIAKVAKDLGILTVGIVTKPFSFEGQKRNKNSGTGLKDLADNVDTLVVVPNDKLFELPNKNISLINAFEEANNILKIGITGVADLITTQGFINLDFADVRTIMANSGLAMLGFGYAEGEGRVKKATEQALSSPLLERPIHGSKRILLNVTGGKDLGLKEANEIAMMITEAAGESTTEVIFGTVMDEKLENAIKITVIATDFTDNYNVSSKSEKEQIFVQRESEEERHSIATEEYENSLDIPALIRRSKQR